jgi:hypothetical protein
MLTYLQIKFESALYPTALIHKSEYLCEFETEFENILGCESGAHIWSIIEKKKQRSTISCYCTFKLILFLSGGNRAQYFFW